MDFNFYQLSLITLAIYPLYIVEFVLYWAALYTFDTKCNFKLVDLACKLSFVAKIQNTLDKDSAPIYVPIWSKDKPYDKLIHEGYGVAGVLMLIFAPMVMFIATILTMKLIASYTLISIVMINIFMLMTLIRIHVWNSKHEN